MSTPTQTVTDIAATGATSSLAAAAVSSAPDIGVAAAPPPPSGASSTTGFNPGVYVSAAGLASAGQGAAQFASTDAAATYTTPSGTYLTAGTYPTAGADALGSALSTLSAPDAQALAGTSLTSIGVTSNDLQVVIANGQIDLALYTPPPTGDSFATLPAPVHTDFAVDPLANMLSAQTMGASAQVDPGVPVR